MGNNDLIYLGVAAGIVFLFKDQILGLVDEFKDKIDEISDKKNTTDGIDEDAKTENQTASEELSPKVKAIDYYAGKIAGSISRIAEENIYSATQLKEHIITHHISDVEKLARMVNYKTEVLGETNYIPLKQYGKIILDVTKMLLIKIKKVDRLALETISGIGAGATNFRPNIDPVVIANIYKHLSNMFSAAPKIETITTTPEIKESNFVKRLTVI